MYLTDITYILRAYAGLKPRTKPTIPISKEQSLLSSRIAVGLQFCFGEICICNNLEKRGAKPLHFRRLFSTFVGDILNYGSVTLFSCDERRKFHRENKWHCPPVVSSRYRRGVVAYFNKSVDKYINLTNRLLRRFYRGFSNDLENVRNSLLCVIILSNNPCQKQR